jgi:hypothetical protein
MKKQSKVSMRTNKEKYDYYFAMLERKAQPFIDSMFLNGKPERFYGLKGRYELMEYVVTGISYKFTIWWTDKPNRQDVEKVKALASESLVFLPENIYLHYEYQMCGKVSGAEKLTDIKPEKGFAFNPNELDEKIAKNRELYEPREGYVPCAYCGKQNHPDNTIRHEIIFQNSHNGRKFIDRATNSYCKDSPCAGWDQMAHEG